MKLKYKIIILNVAALVLMLLIIGPLIVEITDNYNLNTTLNYLQSQGRYAAIYTEQYSLSKTISVFDVPQILEKDASYLCAFLKKTVKCRVQLYSNNKLLGDSEDILEHPSKSLRPEVTQALNGNRAYIITSDKSRTFYYSVPVKIGNRYSYAIGFIYDLKEVDLMRSNTIRIFLLGTITSSLLIIMLSSIISNKITNPIKNLNKVTSEFAKGDLDSRIHITSNDEVGELSITFNKMADNIQGMIQKLKEEKEKQKSFFDNFTHEIRTPLTTIIGYTELLWKTDNQEVKDKSLFHVTSEAKRMLKMIEALLELSRLKKYDFDLIFAKCNLKKLIEDVCDSMYYKAKRNNVTIVQSLKDIVHDVDSDHFKQVLLNIIDNSIKYSKSSIIDISLKEDDSFINLSISDYGVGIDSKDLENVFEPYYKADMSRNSKTEGWGLGLSIVKEIIAKHNGEIIIESLKDKGTRVNICFMKVKK